MGSLLIKALTIRDPKGMSSEGVKNTQLLSREMMGIDMKILLSMLFLSEHRVGEKAILIPRYKNIQEREATIDLFFHGELNGRGPAVEVIKEPIQLLRAMGLDDISVIHIPFPKPRKKTS